MSFCDRLLLLIRLPAQGGTEEADVFEAAVTGPDGSVIFAGWTSGDWNRTNIGAADFAAAKFDTEGNLLWKWQVG